MNPRLSQRPPGGRGTGCADAPSGLRRGFRQQMCSCPLDRPSSELTHAFADTSDVEPGLPAGNRAIGDAQSELAGGDGGQSGGSVVSRTWRRATGSYVQKTCPPFSQTAVMMMLQTQPLREIQGVCHLYHDTLPGRGGAVVEDTSQE